MWSTSGVCTGSPFLIYINDLHNSIKFSQSFHYADDTCLFKLKKTISEINRSIHKDLKQLLFWLKAKQEVMLFKTKHKPCNTDLLLNPLIPAGNKKGAHA